MDERSPVWADEPDGSPYFEEQRKTAAIVTELDDACAVLNRAQRDVFRALIRCDLRRVWTDDDVRDLAHWVACRLGISTWKARRWIDCAWALERYPLFCGAFQDGRLSVDKLVELTRLADAVEEDEPGLLKEALEQSPATLRSRADWARKVTDEVVQEADSQRFIKWWWSEDHSYLNLYGSLPADMGMRVSNALDRIARRLPESPEDYVDPDDPEVSLEALRADALDLLAGQAIAQDKDPDRATVVVHAPLAALTDARVNGMGSAGETLHPEVLRRLTCDGRVQVVTEDDGAIVGIGKTSRLVPRWLRRAVLKRDHFRCTFTNCGSRLGLDVHHVVPWPEGPTEPHNLTALCRTHHRLVHEHKWHVTMAPDQTTRWFRPDWAPYVPRPPSAVPLPEPDREAPEPEVSERQGGRAAASERPAAPTDDAQVQWGIPPDVRLEMAGVF